jgi:NADH-quinone oxidoreductase subunit H
MHQLMSLAWKFMLPMALLNIVAAAVWHFIPSLPARWLVCILILLTPCLILTRNFKQKKKLQIRTYQFAE